jgi:uncharacterized protein YndB with AHSA1/START domain
MRNRTIKFRQGYACGFAAASEMSLQVWGGRRYPRGAMKPLFLSCCLLLGALASPTAQGRILFAEDFTRGLSNGWENVAYFKPPTVYNIVHEGTNYFLRGVADKTSSALSDKLALVPPEKLKLRWRWRISGVNPNGSERDLKKFDHAARVFLAFDTFIGPPRTLIYLWGNVEKTGTVLAHPKSGRAQIFVLESGNARAGEWRAEERDVAADWRQVFGEQSMAKLVGIGLMTDSDSLGQKLTGDYADLELSGE